MNGKKIVETKNTSTQTKKSWLLVKTKTEALYKYCPGR